MDKWKALVDIKRVCTSRAPQGGRARATGRCPASSHTEFLSPFVTP